jgi:RNA polymerase sigma-70 factor (ECF subfamily)
VSAGRQDESTAGVTVVDIRDVVVRYRDDIYRYARWLTRSDRDAEDLAQTALLRALERRPALDDVEKAKWYLLRIVRNLAIDPARARARVMVEPRSNLPEPAATEPGPDEIVLRDAERALSAAALAELADHHREVLRLRFVEGLEYPAVAHRLDVTEHAARQRVYRAVQALRLVARARAIRSA